MPTVASRDNGPTMKMRERSRPFVWRSIKTTTDGHTVTWRCPPYIIELRLGQYEVWKNYRAHPECTSDTLEEAKTIAERLMAGQT